MAEPQTIDLSATNLNDILRGPKIDASTRAAALIVRAQTEKIDGKTFTAEFKKLAATFPAAAANLLLLLQTEQGNSPFPDSWSIPGRQESKAADREFITAAKEFAKTSQGKKLLNSELQTPSERIQRESLLEAMYLSRQLAVIPKTIEHNELPPEKRGATEHAYWDTTKTLAQSLTPILDLPAGKRTEVLKKFNILTLAAGAESPRWLFNRNPKYQDDIAVLDMALNTASSKEQILAGLTYLGLRDLKEKRFDLKDSSTDSNHGFPDRLWSTGNGVIAFERAPFGELKLDSATQNKVIAEFNKTWASKLGVASVEEGIKNYVSTKELAGISDHKELTDPVKSKLEPVLKEAVGLSRAADYVDEARYIAELKGPKELLDHMWGLLQKKRRSEDAAIAVAYNKLTKRDLIADIQSAAFMAADSKAPDLRQSIKRLETFLKEQGIFTDPMRQAVLKAANDVKLTAGIDASITAPKFMEAFQSASSDYQQREVLNTWLGGKSVDQMTAFSKSISFNSEVSNTVEEFVSANSFNPQTLRWAKTLLSGDKKEIELQHLFLTLQTLISEKEGTAISFGFDRRQMLKTLANILDNKSKPESVELAKQFNQRLQAELQVTGKDVSAPKSLDLFQNPNKKELPRNLDQVLDYVTSFSDRLFSSRDAAILKRFRENIKPPEAK